VTPVIIRRERIVSIPADVLWQFIEPVETLPAWLPFVERSLRLGGQGLGRRQRVTMRWGGRRAEIDQEITAYQPGKTIAWTHVAESINGKPAPRVSASVTTTVSMESQGPGTKIVLESQLTPATAGTALLVRYVAARRIRAGFDRALRTLAAIAD
jgi:hypothetical protein